MRGSTCYDQQAQTEKEKKSGTIERALKNWTPQLKKVSEVCKNKKRRKTEKELHHFQDMQISYNDESKKSVFCVAESVESGEILFSYSEWGLVELFVTCLNDNRERKIKPIKNYLDLFY